MTRLARILVVALIAVFAAWSSAHVASATVMSLEMATMNAADDEAMDMPDCGACEAGEMSDQASLACDIACVSPVLADLPAGQAFTSAPMASHAGWSVYDFAGRTYPPDPYPPRMFLLI